MTKKLDDVADRMATRLEKALDLCDAAMEAAEDGKAAIAERKLEAAKAEIRKALEV